MAKSNDQLVKLLLQYSTCSVTWVKKKDGGNKQSGCQVYKCIIGTEKFLKWAFLATIHTSVVYQIATNLSHATEEILEIWQIRPSFHAHFNQFIISRRVLSPLIRCCLFVTISQLSVGYWTSMYCTVEEHPGVILANWLFQPTPNLI